MIVSKDLCLTPEQLQCVNKTKVDNSDCYIKCEGMDVISYNEYEVDSELTRQRHILKLSRMYNEYKGSYEFTTEFKDKSHSFLNCKPIHLF